MEIKKSKLLYLILMVFVIINSSCKSQTNSGKSDMDLLGCWELYDAVKLQDTSDITSSELLQDIKDFNSTLKSLVGSKIMIFDSFFTVDNNLKKGALSMDTVITSGYIDYEKIPDTELTSKYPGDELTDTTLSERKVGETFMKLIGRDSNYIRVLLAKNSQSEYRICLVGSGKIAILSLDQNVLLKFSKCNNK